MKIQKHFLPETYYNERIDKTTGMPVNIDMLVLHCSAYETEKLRQVFVDLGVSAHYIIDQDGSITQLVDESKRAWHAGVGTWRGMGDINSRSIGIEVINPSLGHSTPYTQKQLESVQELAKKIIKTYGILPYNVIAHSDMAPTRKYDPGRLFPWKELSKEGIGLWPTNNQPQDQETDVKKLLQKIGYPVENEAASLRAFMRHFIPEMIPDKENPTMDQYQFLLEYEKNLFSILDKQLPADEKVIHRLKQVANIFEQSCHKGI